LIPRLAVRNKESGKILQDKEGMVWLNPYEKENWLYLVDIAKMAARAGFLEVQFDYVRFSAYNDKYADYGKLAQTTSKTEIIGQFFDFVMQQLGPLKVKVSVDVFGCVIPDTLGEDTIKAAARTGQNYKLISEKVDIICPMIYPSHYRDGLMGIDRPDLEPYQVIYRVLQKAIEVKQQDNKSKAIIRPWLQAFTASWLHVHSYQKYNNKQIDQQMQAAVDAGVNDWCFWNPAAKYIKCSVNYKGLRPH
jgi:hypothetical protein